MLRNDIDKLAEYVKSKGELLEHNRQLFDIYEGLLLDYVLADLKKQLSSDSYDGIKHRVAPINILKRVIEKLSKLYNQTPLRWLENENEQDHELFEWYQKTLKIDQIGMLYNEFYNLFKNSAIEPFIKDGKPALRVIPSDRFLVYSDNVVDPTEPTHFIKLMGMQAYTRNGQQKQGLVIYVYTDEEFLPIVMDGNETFVMDDLLASLNNPEGINPYGKIPYIYVNQSNHSLIPPIDTDTLRMTKMFPILISDLNFAIMYQAFSIVYGINIDDENIRMSPNAFWRFKSDPSTQQKPELGMLKPSVDITQVSQFIGQQLSFWLQSKNIRPGQVGTLAPDQMSSGIAKIVDEMDTWEARQKQVPVFETAEMKLWALILNHMHPYWVANKMIDQNMYFSPGQAVNVQFPEQKPMVKRSEILADLKVELDLGLTTKKEAMIKLNPDMSEPEIDELLKEIEL